MARARDDGDWDDDHPHGRQPELRKRGRPSPGLLVGLGVGGVVLLILVVLAIILIVNAVTKPRLSDENIAKIKSGMSQREVEKIVGSPFSQERFGSEVKAVTWREQGAFLLITFHNDEVVSVTVERRNAWPRTR